MTCTFIATDPHLGRRDVVVEVHPNWWDTTSKAQLDAFARRLYDQRALTGILITPKSTCFFRDNFQSLDFSEQTYNIDTIATTTLFSRMYQGQVYDGEALCMQAKQWLQAVADAWFNAVPDEALPFMLPEIIGGLAGVELEEYNGVLNLAS
jgi:hypothetical protein